MQTENFYTAYQNLQDRFYKQARHDGDIYLPNIIPNGPVDYVLVSMEPSLGFWAKSGNKISAQKAEDLIQKGFKNFLLTYENFIVHYAAQKYLCKNKQTYYMTDISKGAMVVKKANINRQERYERWFSLLQEELDLVSKPTTKIYAIGKAVANFLESHAIKPEATLLHYSSQASSSRSKHIEGKEKAFQYFSHNMKKEDILTIAKNTMGQADFPEDMKNEILVRIAKGNFTDSRKQLLFAYKEIFQKHF
jgi:hypothetical protein